MTFEIIVFIAAVLFGIILYWTESKSNRLYRFFNKLTHSKELQMKPESRKGFIHQQDFLIRLVWITLLYLIVATVIAIVLPFVVNYIQYFISAIVATIIGTYIASLFLFARDKTKKVSTSLPKTSAIILNQKKKLPLNPNQAQNPKRQSKVLEIG